MARTGGIANGYQKESFEQVRSKPMTYTLIGKKGGIVMSKRIFLLYVLALSLFFSGCGQTEDAPAASDDNNQAEVAVNEPTDPENNEQTTDSSDSSALRLYTLEEYCQIQPGQSYEDVQKIMGDLGENMVDNERLKQYQWNNEDGSMISVTFYDNEMTGKSQAHLGPLLEGGQVVTEGMFNQLEEGMTLGEVNSILGPGTERVFTIIDGEVEQIIGWENSDGGEISVTATDGVVTEFSDLMLK